MFDITDEEALEAMHSRVSGRAQSCTEFAERTIVYPVKVQRNPNSPPEIEIRPFIRMGEHYSPRKMEKAKDVAKRYAKINNDYQAELKRKGLPTFKKAPANILNSNPIEFK